MLITITIVSILAITAVVWLANRVLPFNVCPICAGIFLTWAWLLGAYFFGYQIPPEIPALLMGGSVVGIAYQLEKKLGGISPPPRLLWKILFIPAGFVAGYSILSEQWTILLFTSVFLLFTSLLFLNAGWKSGTRGESASEVEKKMKDCC
ncbi:MAG: hypothetical protein Q7S75_00735 [bacterium]|nr:hypothetical protein [bacterium]